MAQYEEEIVNVQIADATQPLDTTSFNLPMILATHNNFTTRTQRYTSLAAIVAAGFDSTSAVYKQAALMFMGEVNKPSSILVGRRAAGETITQALIKIEEENNNWFWMTCDSHVKADVLELANWAETSDKIYMFSSSDENIREAAAGNLLDELRNMGYEQTYFIQWAADADTTFPEAAAIGVTAGRNIDANGTDTLNGKTLKGIQPCKLTISQKDNIVGQGGNVYDAFRGTGFYREGRSVGGKYLDLVVFKLWMKYRIKESVGSLLKRASSSGRSVHFDTAGIEKVKQAIWNNPINVGIQNGTISNEMPTKADGTTLDWRPKVFIPSIADITEDDQANRVLSGVQVEVVYTSFIHTVKITANVLLRRD